MKQLANRYVLVFVGLYATAAVCLNGCSSHDKALRKFDHEIDSKKISKLSQPAGHDTPPSADTVSPASPGSDLTAAEYERLGDMYLGKGDPINTFVNYEKSLQKDPKNMRIHYKKGLLFLIEDMSNDARDSFEKVLEKEPDNAIAHQGLGQAFFQLKQYEKSKEQLLKAVALDVKLWNSYNLLGIIYDYEKNYPSAILEYEKAISLKTDNGILYNNMGLSYSMAGDYEKAIDTFHKAVKAGYTEDRVFNNLGFALFMTGRKREAFEAFKKAGDEAQALNNLGSMYLSQGEHEKASKCFEDAIALKPAFYDQAHENLKKCRIRDINELISSAEDKKNDMSTYPLKNKSAALATSGQKEILSYTVKEGDTPFSIAQRHNMDLSDFLKLNNLSPESPIYRDKTVLVKPQ